MPNAVKYSIHVSLQQGINGGVHHVQSSADGESFLIYSRWADGGEVRLCRARDGQLVQVLRAFKDGSEPACFSPRGSAVLIASDGQHEYCRLHRADSGALVGTVEGNELGVRANRSSSSALCFSRCGSFVAAGQGQDLAVWSVQDFAIKTAIFPRTRADSRLYALACDGAAKLLFAATAHGLEVWSWRRGARRSLLRTHDESTEDRKSVV